MKPMVAVRAVLFGLLLMLYFFICDILGVADNTKLRFFNFVILVVGLWTTLYAEARQGKDFGLKYFSGLRDGAVFTLITAGVFALCFFLYLWLHDFILIDQFIAKGIINESITALHLVMLILTELISAGFILSFSIMQYFKYSHKKEEELDRKHES